MKNTLIFIALLSLVSCARPVTEEASAVCNCYKELYRIAEDDIVTMEAVADSCKKVHAAILNKLEGNQEEKDKFIEAYTACQNAK